MTDKILIDRELLESTLQCLTNLWSSDEYIDSIKEKLRAALDAPQQEAVATVKKNAAGQIYMVGADGKSFDVSKHIGESFYLHPAPSVPEGWKLVPKKPTPEMLDVTMFPQGAAQLYRAMLSAAPKAPTADDRKDAEPWKERLRRIYDTLPDEAKKFYGKHGFAAYCAALDAEINAAMAAQKGEKG